MQLKILLLKLGIKEVVWQKIIKKFPNTVISVQIFHWNRQKLLYELIVTSLFNVGILKCDIFFFFLYYKMSGVQQK